MLGDTLYLISGQLVAVYRRTYVLLQILSTIIRDNED